MSLTVSLPSTASLMPTITTSGPNVGRPGRDWQRFATRAFALLLVAFSTLLTPVMSQAQTFTILHTFEGSDGSDSISRVTRDAAGNTYGATLGGGTAGIGTVFKLDPMGNITVLHNFVGGASDGAYSYGGVTRDTAGNLYGTTINGGTANCGVVYKIDAGGTFTLLHNFTGGNDGCTLYATLTQDSAGTLYGTTRLGGTHSWGTVFKLDSHGTKTVLHNFVRKTEGRYPEDGVIRDSNGNLYGTTTSGGAFESGTIFTMNSAGKITRLITLTTPDFPNIRLIRDAAGNLYGTTRFGGTTGGGTIFKVDSHGNKSVLYNFGTSGPGYGPNGGLSRDAAGNLYGTATFGGENGFGSVFKLDTSGVYSELHQFVPDPDGDYPAGGVALDSNGNLYGTTQNAGDFSCGGGPGCGTIFKITP
jgi:uncharacterized repeat protein (TIGR03803 family)